MNVFIAIMVFRLRFLQELYSQDRELCSYPTLRLIGINVRTYRALITCATKTSSCLPFLPDTMTLLARNSTPQPVGDKLIGAAPAAIAMLLPVLLPLGGSSTSPSRSNRGDRSRRRSSNGDQSVTSPPVSVKVKTHSDGRHVTLRRLSEEETAAARVNWRRQERSP